jgi:Fe-S oxidoreductase
MEKLLATFEDSWVTATFGIGRLVNKMINLSWFMSWPNRQEQEAFNRRPRNIALLLEAAEVTCGYLRDHELYAGALIYDEGVDDVFEKHARKVYDKLKDHGVKRVITIDPHTTNVLRSVYPEIIDDYKLDVKSYLEVLAEQNMSLERSLDRDVVIHDSCVYARHENVVEEPRDLLKKAGAGLQEPDYSRKRTMCCGGPIESFFPSKTKDLAKKRIEQLADCGTEVAAMCPICLVNLQHAAEDGDVAVRDISDYLAEAFCPKCYAPMGA